MTFEKWLSLNASSCHIKLKISLSSTKPYPSSPLTCIYLGPITTQRWSHNASIPWYRTNPTNMIKERKCEEKNKGRSRRGGKKPKRWGFSIPSRLKTSQWEHGEGDIVYTPSVKESWESRKKAHKTYRNLERLWRELPKDSILIGLGCIGKLWERVIGGRNRKDGGFRILIPPGLAKRRA